MPPPTGERGRAHPAGDPAWVKEQHLDRRGVDLAILTGSLLSLGVQTNADLAAAIAAGVNDWTLEMWVRPFDCYKGSILVAQSADAEVVMAKNPKIAIRTPDKSKPWGWLDWWPNAFSFNDMKPPYDDPDIRWAINYAIDRQAIVDVGFQGQSTEALIPLPAYTPMLPFFDAVKDLQQQCPIGTNDPSKTEQIMKSKGYAKDSDGSGRRAASGSQWLFSLHPVSSRILRPSSSHNSARPASMPRSRLRRTKPRSFRPVTWTRTSRPPGQRAGSVFEHEPLPQPVQRANGRGSSAADALEKY